MRRMSWVDYYSLLPRIMIMDTSKAWIMLFQGYFKGHGPTKRNNKDPSGPETLTTQQSRQAEMG
jgi:hypothetical protein